ncbi:MAG: biosynthetic arginine decarboxylase [Planctomycetota bacterium]
MTTTIPKADIEARAPWTVADAARLYRLAEWGRGYFDVNAEGNVVVFPDKTTGRSVDLYRVVQGLAERGLRSPILLRFTDLLAHRLREIRSAFDRAIADAEYKGGYSCVYPIKVNQQRHICEEIRDFGAKLGFGLEAGSKPELLAVLALTEGHDQMPIICNGFKDDEFAETVILATKLGRNIVPVVEKFSELELIVKHAERYNVRPQLGVRVKLFSRGVGRWENSAGTHSKFGLFVSEVLRAVDYLRERNMLDCLRLLHCHIGSQVHDIRTVVQMTTELTHVYTELKRLGAAMGMLDIGGGLAVDYDGTQSATDSSANYGVDEYASTVLWRIKSICDEADCPHPLLVTESGRAMVAYGSVLVCNVVGKSSFDARPQMDWIKSVIDREDEIPQPINDLLTTYETLARGKVVELYHDATQARDEAISLFSLGYMSLPLRAVAEQLFWCIGYELLKKVTKEDPSQLKRSEELQDLPDLLSDIYFCNFSLFQSAPDSWAIGQLFPICPIHRLTEQPTRRGTLADITCDSDGKVDRFVDPEIEKRTLELHDLIPSIEGDYYDPYYLGVFLVGAYQEILGDLHNLLGDTHAVHISVADDGDWRLEEVIEGDTVREVLSYVQFEHLDMRRSLRRNVEQAVRENRLTLSEGKSLLQFYNDGLDGYTYLED